MKKLILKISHFFGYRLDEQHIDDITVEIAKNKYYEPYHIKYEEYPNWIINDIIEQVYKRFDGDKNIEKRCRYANKVFVKYNRPFRGTRSHFLTYLDGKLYHPDDKVIIRDKILKELLNEK